MTKRMVTADGPTVRAEIDIDELFRSYHSWLVKRLTHRLGCREKAADLAQDTFLRLLGVPARTHPRRPKALLGTIARGLVIDSLRRAMLERLYLESLARLPEVRAQSSEEIVAAVETLNRISRVLDGLGQRPRAVFLLARIDGLSYPLIANRLNVSLSTVEKDMALALRHCYSVWYDQ
ncbi:MAG: sigma-70 family RNA polymerase sigma factor [Pseudomonadota bacterium]